MLKFNRAFAQFVCNQVPVGYIAELADMYMAQTPKRSVDSLSSGITDKDIKNLKKALDDGFGTQSNRHDA